jgi:hypothetical protein
MSAVAPNTCRQTVAQCMNSENIIRKIWGVCTENSDSNVLVMQAADQGMRYDASGALNRARDGRILV